MAERAMIVNGYAYPSIDPQLLAQTAPDLTFVSAFSYGVRGSGEVILLNDETIRETAAPFGVRPLMVLSVLTGNGTFDSESAAKLLLSPEAQERMIGEILINLSLKGMYGVDFDFEYIPAEYREGYVEMIAKTRMRLNEEGYIVTAALAPKVATDQQGLLYEGHDYKGVGQAANLVLLMTYEWGYT